MSKIKLKVFNERQKFQESSWLQSVKLLIKNVMVLSRVRLTSGLGESMGLFYDYRKRLASLSLSKSVRISNDKLIHP